MKLAIIIALSALTQFCTATAPSPACHHDNVLRALLRRSTDAFSFCATYLGTSSLSASVILYDITIVGGTQTDTYGPTDIATLFSNAGTKTLRTKTVTTTYAHQVPARTALSTKFSVPTPASYVATYPVSRISSACSCLIPSAAIENILVNVNCDAPTQYVSTQTFTDATVFTATGGKSTTTLIVTLTDTLITSTQTVTLPFPTTCPLQANAQYIGCDGSPWTRSCENSWGGSSTLSSVAAKNLDACIDSCVAHNEHLKYVECVAVSFTPPSTAGAKGTCDLLSFATFPNGNGVLEIAQLDFYQEPFPKVPPGFCESAVSSFTATATPIH